MPTVYTDKPLPKRHDKDFYRTDPDVAYAAITQLLTPPRYPHDGTLTRWLDPGAGTGVWGEAIRRAYPSAHITGVELRDEELKPDSYNQWFEGDFLRWPNMFHLSSMTGKRFTHVVGNPPFSLSEKFVRHGLSLLESGGQLLYLLNLSFLASQVRGVGLGRVKKEDALFQAFPPDKVWICSRRLSFSEDKKTAPEEYAMFRWTKHAGNADTKLFWWDWKSDGKE